MMQFPQYESYKDSGVEWFGEIPENWKVESIKRSLKVLTDYTANGSFATLAKNVVYKKEGYARLIRLTDLRDNLSNDGLYVDERAYKFLSKTKLYGGELLVANVGAYTGLVKVVPRLTSKATLAPNMFLAVFKEHLLPNYTYYQLNSVCCFEQFRYEMTATAQPKLNKDNFRSISILIPPIKEQQRVVDFLDQKTAEIDKAIAKKQKLIELLQEQKAILINRAVTKGLNPNVTMRDSGIEWIGEIPEHWEIKKLKYVTRQIIDGAHHTPTYVQEGIPFLRVKDISRNIKINVADIKYIPLSEHIELCKRARAEKGDILLSKNGTIGVTKVVDWDFDFSFFVSLCLIKPRKELVAKYFCLFFGSPLVDEQLSFGSKRTSVTNLHLDKIKELIIVLPPFEEQLRICENINIKCKPHNNLIENTLREIELLNEFKSILISNAVTGKIKI